ncbi:cell envelope integrity protein TolA [Chiayiivirga flava]|uniref:Colicin import membrane protein n=1 Tax=Chiayiivirga flava TaxID=659595 RepID=A0A7W8D7S8_9GAMM|nr:cell envelope integrity protein TolA [Chiayiivirga flava]MBB5209479.1 colicin import membrane protein [Chiayiivirga flava]
METTAQKLRALVYAILVHLVCLGLMFVGLLWSPANESISVAGGAIEATLVAPSSAASAAASARPAPPRPTPRPEPRDTAPAPQPKPTPAPQETPQEAQPTPQAPIPKPDTVDQEAAAVLSAQREAAKVQREQEERRRQEQVLLDQQKQEEAERKLRLTKMEEERQAQLDDIRRRREAAEKQRKLEEQKLQQLADARNAGTPRPAPAQPAASTQPPSDRLGNGGTDDGLAGRYALAIQQAVTSNWLRPDSARPGIVCTLRIVQIPGGEVIQASVTSPCNADDLTRRSIEAAVLKAQPLPYRGYESVFKRSVNFTFTYNG